ncbi:MAG: FAD-dependent oxidoreductase [Inquilinus sp.]|uniref:FAD-dependent oxidoreductase n=1 Tax=Inquilinus sp. TaxID=1932117 RepID=UPI003F400787
MVWETSEPYLCTRSTPDGRVIAGGKDSPLADDDRRDTEIPKKSRAIARRIDAMWRSLDPAPMYRWAGSFGESRTGLPSIGRMPGLDRCHAVPGNGGTGFTFSAIAAQHLPRDHRPVGSGRGAVRVPLLVKAFSAATVRDSGSVGPYARRRKYISMQME